MGNRPRGSDRWRTALAVSLLALGLTSLAWATVLSFGGGLSLTIMGQVLRSHDPYRPLVAGLVALGLFAGFGERELGLWQRLSGLGRFGHGCLAVMLAVATFGVTLVYSGTAAGASDPYGYVSQADRWLKGQLALAQPWAAEVPWPSPYQTFTPLGYYSQAIGREPSELLPSYSPGLPMLMAGAKAVGGQEGLFWIVPMMAGLLVLATYGLGCRLLSPTAGLIAAWLVATSPAVLFMASLPMSDVPVAAAWATAFYFLFGSTLRSAAMAGLIVAMAIVIRPNLVFAVPIVATWYLMAMWRADKGVRRRAGGEALAFLLAVLPGPLFIAMFNAAMNGSPLISGYGNLDGLFAVTNFWPNMWSYSRWLAETQTPLVMVGIVALVPSARFWPGARERSAVAVGAAFSLALWIFYGFYMRFDTWWALRLLLPIWPFVLIGVGTAIVALGRGRSAAIQIGVAALVVTLGVFTIRLAAERQTFTLWEDYRRYPSVGRLLRETTEPNSVILAVLHSGSARYYGGRVTLRYDILEPQWLDRAVAWLAAHGAHPYLLVEEWELREVTLRFPDQQTLRLLAGPPVFIHQGIAGPARLFDLVKRPSGEEAPTPILRQTDTTRSQTPVEMDPLRFEQR
jgi:hypothetical protein